MMYEREHELKIRLRKTVGMLLAQKCCVLQDDPKRQRERQLDHPKQAPRVLQSSPQTAQISHNTSSSHRTTATATNSPYLLHPNLYLPHLRPLPRSHHPANPNRHLQILLIAQRHQIPLFILNLQPEPTSPQSKFHPDQLRQLRKSHRRRGHDIAHILRVDFDPDFADVWRGRAAGVRAVSCCSCCGARRDDFEG